MNTARWVAVVGSSVFGVGVTTMLTVAVLSHLDGKGQHRKANGDGDQLCGHEEAHNSN